MTDGEWFAAGVIAAIGGSLITAIIGAVVTIKVEAARRADTGRREAYADTMRSGDALGRAIMHVLDTSNPPDFDELEQAHGDFLHAYAPTRLMAGAAVLEAVKAWAASLSDAMAVAQDLVQHETDIAGRHKAFADWVVQNEVPHRTATEVAMRRELGTKD